MADPVRRSDPVGDDAALRAGRRARALAAMAAHDLDVMVLGREANARYVSGARRLWIAGSRAFGPGCVLVRATGAVHLLSTWDEGVPDDIPHERLYGITFNPMNLVTVLQGVDGAAQARRVGTDSMTPLFAHLLPRAFPAAELVDVEPAMRAARRCKTPEEIAAIRAALAVAEQGLAATVAELAPGATPRALTGRFMAEVARLGVSTPATQEAVWVTSRDHPWRRTRSDRPIAPGDLVSFTAGVLAGGYSGEVGRTWLVGAGDDGDGPPARLARRWEELRGRLVGACRAGSPGTVLLDAYTAAGEPVPPMAVGRGLGLGFDTPIVAGDLPATAAAECLDPDMVLAVTATVWEHGVGAIFGQEAVLVTSGDPELLSTSPRWTGAAPFENVRVDLEEQHRA